MISGNVYDAMTGQPLIGAVIAELDGSGTVVNGTTTDSNGNFSLSMNNSSDQLRVSYIGFQTVYVDPADAGSISLFSSTNQLPGVTVTAPPYVQKPVNYSQTNNASMSQIWTDLKPLLLPVAIIFVAGYLINQSHEKSRKKYRR